MNLKRYTGRTSSEALAKVREELGDDAVVLSTKPVAGGVEVLALAPEGMQALEAAAAQAPAAAPPARAGDGAAEAVLFTPPQPLAARARSFAERLLQRGERVEPTLDMPEPAAAGRQASVGGASGADVIDGSENTAVEADVKALGMSTLTFQDYVRERMLRRRQTELDRQSGAAQAPAERRPAQAGHAVLAQDGQGRPDRDTARPAQRDAERLAEHPPEHRPDQHTDLAPRTATARLREVAESMPRGPSLVDDVPLFEAPAHGRAPIRADERAESPAPLRVVAPARREAMNPGRDDATARLRQERGDGEFPRRAVRHQIPMGAQRTPATPRLDEDDAPIGRSTAGASSGFSARERDEMMGELRSMRSLIEERFGMLAFMDKLGKHPTQVQLSQQLFDIGLSPGMVRKLVQALPETVTDGLAWAQTVLESNLQTNENEAAIEDHEGVFALIGPTGVGKTTSTAKIAAAFAAKHGAGNLGLITLDAYRVGAHEQLRTYGRILGVPVHTAHDRASLEDLLELLSAKKLVLVDTAGMAQRDHRTRELLEMLSNPAIRKLLVVNAAAQGETVEDVMTGYRAHTCDGVIVSKLDEAVKLGPALDALIRHTARVVGVANGQRVPEDWHRLSAKALVQRALHGGGGASWRFNASEVNLMFAATHAHQTHQPQSAAGLTT